MYTIGLKFLVLDQFIKTEKKLRMKKNLRMNFFFNYTRFHSNNNFKRTLV